MGSRSCTVANAAAAPFKKFIVEDSAPSSLESDWIADWACNEIAWSGARSSPDSMIWIYCLNSIVSIIEGL